MHNLKKIIFLFLINIQVWANPMLSYLDDEEIGAGSTSIFGIIFNIIVWGGLLYYWIWGNQAKETIEDDVDSMSNIDPYQIKFDTLVEKLHDRDRDLGACFERNIIFKSYENNTLTWTSHANGDDKKLLIAHWGVINMFVKDTFGYETKIVNISLKQS